MMTKNPILDDLRKTREQLLSEAGGTLEGLVAQLQRDERQSGKDFVLPKAQINRMRDTAESKHSKMEDQPTAAR